MLPLVDVHCHLLAGLDDGPQDWHQALDMCRLAAADGTRAIAATAHQSEHWPLVTPQQILQHTRELRQRVEAAGLPLSIYPAAEVMIGPDVESAWEEGALLSVADRGRYLLMEMPGDQLLDLQDLVGHFVELGVRPILAHPERHPELLHTDGAIESLILGGCLIQVSASSITQARHPELAAGVRSWACRGIIHLIGSDGHSATRRPPGISAAYERLAEWIGWGAADRICSTNGMAALEGLPIEVPRPRARKRRWFARN